MVKQLYARSLLVALLGGGLMVVLIAVATRGSNGEPSTPGAVETEPNSIDGPNRPVVIWFHTVETDPEILRLAISSGVFSHVILSWLHEYDRPDYRVSVNLKKELKICRDNGVKVIWCRWLYPGYKFRDFGYKTAFEAEYYANRIESIKKEARQMGIGLVALDAEPYGNCPLNLLKAQRGGELRRAEFMVLTNAVKTATEIAGQVDFVLPAGSFYPLHLYNGTTALGKLAIAEFTYFDIPWRLKSDHIRYDVFGAYVSLRKQNKKHPDLPYFTPGEILSRQDLWAHKKGLFIYPGTASTNKKHVEAVAAEFSRIKAIRPLHDSNDVR